MLGACLGRIYQGVFLAMMVCRTPDQSPMCQGNETVTGWATAACIPALVVIGVALKLARRRV